MTANKNHKGHNTAFISLSVIFTVQGEEGTLGLCTAMVISSLTFHTELEQEESSTHATFCSLNQNKRQYQDAYY